MTDTLRLNKSVWTNIIFSVEEFVIEAAKKRLEKRLEKYAYLRVAKHWKAYPRTWLCHLVKKR